MFSTDFIFRQQENLVDNRKCQAGFRPLFNKILLSPLCLALKSLLQFIQMSHKSLSNGSNANRTEIKLAYRSFNNYVKIILPFFDYLPQIREQMSGPDLHVLTLRLLALKKLGFLP